MKPLLPQLALGLLLLGSPAFGEPVPAPAAAAAPAPAPPAPGIEIPFHPDLRYQDQLLNQDTVWRGQVLVEGVVTVAPQATLTIEPGTVIRFRGKGEALPLLLVQGRIVAAGSQEAPVRFGSAFDPAAAGQWQGILLLASEKKNLLENCRIEGAQTGIEALFSELTLKGVQVTRSRTGMRFQDTLLSMDGGGAEGCALGLAFSDSEANLRGVRVGSGRDGVAASRSSLFLKDSDIAGNSGVGFSADQSRIKIQGGAFLENGSGISLNGSQGSVAGAKLSKNGRFALSLSASRVRVSGNEITDNTGAGLQVEDGAAVAWGNTFSGNAGYDLFNLGTEEFRAPGNWWGGAAPRIFDNGGRAPVSCNPLLKERPHPVL